MKSAIFYLLEQDTIDDGLTTMEWLACDLAISKWREGKSILIVCEENIQAIRLDEALWTRDPNAFIPHNLTRDGPRYGAPVEIFWPQCQENVSRDLLINLLPINVDFFSNFHKVIDFVPAREALKELARDRYKAYRSAGFQLKIAKPPM